MKDNKGFTLVELLGVIIILAAIALISFPLILEQIRKTQGELDKASKELIISSAELYIDKNISKYPRIVDNVYCITLNTLNSSGDLNSSIIDNINKGNINIEQTVKVEVTNIGYEYDLVPSSECIEVNK
ncbi:MAG TPA: prepilin-type N-terminal cleavage/methylation domain-containing protein [Tenericutes bacterium]|nr:prepilin-type N-terminal cleavage/methylation domain-containing protein [Mycoplasmatota bacterium]